MSEGIRENPNRSGRSENPGRRRGDLRLAKLQECFLGFGPDAVQNIDRLTATCGELLGASFALYCRMERGMLCSWGKWNAPPGYKSVDVPEGHICYDVIRDAPKDTVVIRHLQETPYFGTDPNVRSYGLHTYVGRAVTFGSECVGSLCVYYREDRTPSEDDYQLLGAIAAAIGVEEERKRATEALRESEERYRRLVEMAPDMIAVESEGTVVYINGAGARLFGADSPRDIVGRPVMELVHPDFREMARSRLQEMVEGKPQSLEEAKFLRLDGGVVDVQLAATPLVYDGLPAVQVFVRNISEQKRVQEALRVSGETLGALVESSPLAIVTFGPDGRIRMWNPAAERMFGWTAEEAQGKLHPIVPVDKQDEFRKFRELAMSGHSFTGVEVRRRRKDGSEIDINVSTAPLRDASGAITSIMSIITDVTERRRTEQALKASEEQLRQAQKMEAVGRLAGGIAHDFNNLLTAVTGYSELLLKRIDVDDPMWKELDEIRRAGERAAGLTRQLLAFSRRQVIQPKILDLNAIVSNIDKMLCRLIGEDVELVTSLAEDLGYVRADPGQVEQILMNLAVNARDSMPRGGRLVVETANVELDVSGAHWLIDAAAGRYVMLSVKDAGSGMNEEVRSHLFEPFFTTKEEGTGLGLATVYGIVKQSGGTIRVDSAPGQGTTFEIYLPRVAGEPEIQEEGKGSPPHGKGMETVLVVEDEDMVRELVCEILKACGYRVLAASHAGEALAIAEKHKGPIHLMVTDVVMPRMSGSQLARRLIPMRPEMRVLYMSGYTDDAILHHGVLEGGTAFLQKPFRPEVLTGKVREILGGAPGNAGGV